MLIHAKRKELSAIAAQVAKAAPKRADTAAACGIHIEADANRSIVTLTATNYELAIRSSIAAVVEQPGSTVINASLLPAVLSHLAEDDVDVELTAPNLISIRSGQAQYTLNVLPGEQYPMPELPFPEDTVPVSGLRSLVQNTIFAVAEGKQMPILHCVRLPC